MAQAARFQFQASDLDANLSEANSAQRVGDVFVGIYEDLSIVEEEWRTFEQHADGTVFQTFEWLATWQQHIGLQNGVRPAVVIGRDPRGVILFLLPLAIERIKSIKA